MKLLRLPALLLSLGILSLNCKTGTSQPVQPPVVYLKDVAKFPIGASVSPTLLKNNPAYRQVAGREYTSLTCENAMKMRGLHPEATRYTWSDADAIVQFAKERNIRMHGHTLLWHQSVPDWITNFQGDTPAWEALLKDHIQTVVRHYQGQVASWDVVNEAFSDDGTLRNSIWRQKLGDDYLARCFQYAREADPQVLLFYNDYGQEYATRKMQAILDMVADFKKRNIPIDGLGLQLHINVNTSDANIQNLFQKAAATGLKLHVSELDVSVNPKGETTMTYTDDLKEKQASRYELVFRTFRALPAAQQHGVTTWNIGDADTWLRSFYKRQDFPLLFDDQYQPKPVYERLVKVLK